MDKGIVIYKLNYRIDTCIYLCYHKYHNLTVNSLMAEQYDIIIITVTARQKLVNQHVFNQEYHIKIKAITIQNDIK